VYNQTQCDSGKGDEETLDMCRIVRAIYSSWMSASVMMIAYVLYNMCRFSFNCTYRDKLTLIIQVLSLASLISNINNILYMNSKMHRGRHGSSNSIRKISQYIYFDISSFIQPSC